MAEDNEKSTDAEYLDEDGKLDLKKLVHQASSLQDGEQETVPHLLKLLERFTSEETAKDANGNRKSQCFNAIYQASTRFKDDKHLKSGLDTVRRIWSDEHFHDFDWTLVQSIKNIYAENPASDYLAGLTQLVQDRINETPQDKIGRFYHFLDAKPNELPQDAGVTERIFESASNHTINLAAAAKYLNRRFEDAPDWALEKFNTLYMNFNISEEHASQFPLPMQVLYNFYKQEEKKVSSKVELAQADGLQERAMEAIRESLADNPYLNDGYLEVHKLAEITENLKDGDQEKVPHLLKLLERFSLEKAKSYTFMTVPSRGISAIAKASTHFNNPEHLQSGLGILRKLVNEDSSYWSQIIRNSAKDAPSQDLNDLAIKLIDETPKEDLHKFQYFLGDNFNLNIGLGRAANIVENSIGKAINVNNVFNHLNFRSENAPEWSLEKFNDIYFNYNIDNSNCPANNFNIDYHDFDFNFVAEAYHFYEAERNNVSSKEELAKVPDLQKRALEMIKEKIAVKNTEREIARQEQIAIREAAHKKAQHESDVYNVQSMVSDGHIEGANICGLSTLLATLKQNESPEADSSTIRVAVELKQTIVDHGVKLIDEYMAERYQDVFASKNKLVSGFNSLMGKSKDGRGRDGKYPEFSYETMDAEKKEQLIKNMQDYMPSDLSAMKSILEEYVNELQASYNKKDIKERELRLAQIESLEKHDMPFMDAVNQAADAAREAAEAAQNNEPKEDKAEDSSNNLENNEPQNEIQDEDSAAKDSQEEKDDEKEDENALIINMGVKDDELENEDVLGIIPGDDKEAEDDVPPAPKDEKNDEKEDNVLIINMGVKDDELENQDEDVLGIIPADDKKTENDNIPAPKEENGDGEIPSGNNEEDVTPTVPPASEDKWVDKILKPAPKHPEVTLKEAIEEVSNRSQSEITLKADKEQSTPEVPHYELNKPATNIPEGKLRLDGPHEVTLASEEFKHFIMIAKSSKLSGHNVLKLGQTSDDEVEAKKFAANLVLAGAVEGIEVNCSYSMDELKAVNPKIGILIDKQKIRAEMKQLRENLKEVEKGGDVVAINAAQAALDTAKENALQYQMEHGSIDVRNQSNSKAHIEKVLKKLETSIVTPRYERDADGKVVKDDVGAPKMKEDQKENTQRVERIYDNNAIIAKVLKAHEK